MGTCTHKSPLSGKMEEEWLEEEEEKEKEGGRERERGRKRKRKRKEEKEKEGGREREKGRKKREKMANSDSSGAESCVRSDDIMDIMKEKRMCLGRVLVTGEGEGEGDFGVYLYIQPLQSPGVLGQ